MATFKVLKRHNEKNNAISEADLGPLQHLKNNTFWRWFTAEVAI